MANSTVWQTRLNKNKYLNHGVPSQRHIVKQQLNGKKIFEDAVIESEARFAVVQLKSEA